MWDRNLPHGVEPFEVYIGDHVVQEYFIEQMAETVGLLVVVGPLDFTGWSLSSEWRGGGREVDLNVTTQDAGVLRMTSTR